VETGEEIEGKDDHFKGKKEKTDFHSKEDRVNQSFLLAPTSKD
jgi:hypothetical protein